MGQIKVLFPFKDREEIWLGLDTPGFRRKVFRTVDKKLVDSEYIVAELTVFEPGKVSAVE
jgi:putative monooxygenase